MRAQPARSNHHERWGHRWDIATHVEDISPEEMARRAAELANAPSTSE